MGVPTGKTIDIASDKLRVSINPWVGGTITSITHLGLGLSVLGQVPWDPIDAPIDGLGATSEAHWLTRYSGGWPVLFPNGGDACTVGGCFHGFHGEASVAAWKASASRGRLELTRRFFTVPVEMHREITVEGDLLTVRERVRMLGPMPLDVMWAHHPTFGSDLLSGNVEITTGGRRAVADAGYDPSANPLLAGAAAAWPTLPGKAGPFDLSRPAGPLALMAYILDFDASWVAIRRLDNAVAAALSWTADRFPCAWLWCELGGTGEAPWHGRGRLIGLEPSTTWPANGLADALRRGSSLLRLHPGDELGAEVRLHIFRPQGPVLRLDGAGRAIAA